MALITTLRAEKRVVIFSKSSCCLCNTIKKLIHSFGVNLTVFELDEHPNGKEMEKELKELGCKPTVPTVLTGHDLLAGPNEIMSLHLNGKLAPLLIKANG